MSKAQVLIVDDESDILELLQITLARMDIDCRAAMDIATAKSLLASSRFDLCLTDMCLPDGSGIALVQHIADTQAELPVAVITAHGNMETAVAAMKAGAFDFVAKPVVLETLRKLVESALRLRGTGGQTVGAIASGAQGGLLGESQKMQDLRRLIGKLARNQAPVLISGESGTGKELAARLIHSLGPRAKGAFVPVNCGAIPQDLMESELFGHKKGSFTGAVSDKEGLFHAAEGGTLFLDEVADLPLDMQVKLLRAIQEKRVRPVGAQHELPVDVRIISASHLNLGLQVEKRAFRQDLYYRINVIELHMPALREIPKDIPLLADHILSRIARQSGGPKPALTSAAMTTLERYAFPGNVRELENVLERATALNENGVVDADDLHLPQAAPTAAPPLAQDEKQPLEDYLDEVERRAIIQSLDETGWTHSAAAKKLGITLRSLRYRLSKLGIE